MGMNEKAYSLVGEQKQELDYSQIAQSASFKRLLQEKRKFIIPFTVFFLAFYFTLPLLTAYSDTLNRSAIGDITWAWIFAATQFIMTWTLCMIYSGKAKKFDKMVDEIIEESK